MSEVRATSRATEVGHYFHYKNITGLFRQYNRALPPYNRALPLLLPPLFKTIEEVVVGFQIFAWAPKKKEYKFGLKKC
jgi:hypothetical protein